MTAGVDARGVLAFCLAGYGTGIFVTPLLIGLVAVSVVGVDLIACTLVGGLVLPTIAGRALSGRIRRLPDRLRRVRRCSAVRAGA